MKLTTATAALTMLATLTPAFAVTQAPATPPAPTAPAKIESLTPGEKSGALFVNVKRVFDLYGDLIKGSKAYKQVEEAIAKGCPDPSKDITEVGVSTDIENLSKSDVGAVVTGSIDLGKALKFLQTLGTPGHPVNFVPSMYRGLTLMSAKDDQQTVQVGAYDEHTNVVAVSSKQESPLAPTKAVVGTLKGESPSFAKVSGLSLPANYLANLSLKVPASLRDQAAGAAGESAETIRKLSLISASVVADDRAKDAAIELRLTCDDEAGAKALYGLAQQLVGAASGSGSFGSLAQQIKLSLSGNTVLATLVVPRAEIERAAAGL